ncbi:hypothetical protein ACFQ0B_78860 [Nonomuraea thailandensis]
MSNAEREIAVRCLYAKQIDLEVRSMHDRRRGGTGGQPGDRGGEELRCGNPGCAELWATPDGLPRPLEYGGAGRKPKHCSRRCTNAVSNARKRSHDQRRTQLQSTFAATVAEHRPALSALADTVSAQLAAEVALLRRIETELLERVADLEEQLVDERAAATEAERRTTAADERARTTEQNARNAVERAAAAEGIAAQAAAAQRTAEEQARLAEHHAEAAEERADAAEEQARTDRALATQANRQLTETASRHAEQLRQLRAEHGAALAGERERAAAAERELAALQERHRAGVAELQRLRHRAEETVAAAEQARAETATLRAQLHAAEERNADLARQVAQARHEESEARDLLKVHNSRLEEAERARDTAHAAQRASEQHAEHLQQNLTLLLQRLPVSTTEPGIPPGEGTQAEH